MWTIRLNGLCWVAGAHPVVSYRKWMTTSPAMLKMVGGPPQLTPHGAAFHAGAEVTCWIPSLSGEKDWNRFLCWFLVLLRAHLPPELRQDSHPDWWKTRPFSSHQFLLVRVAQNTLEIVHFPGTRGGITYWRMYWYDEEGSAPMIQGQSRNQCIPTGFRGSGHKTKPCVLSDFQMNPGQGKSKVCQGHALLVNMLTLL